MVNKLSRPPRGDWNQDADDVRNLVGVVSREWKTLLTWQVVDPDTADIQDMLQAPIAFFNGHHAPEFTAAGHEESTRLCRSGGLHLRRSVLRQVRIRPRLQAIGERRCFPKPEYQLRPLSPDHAVWRAKHLLSPEIHPLWGIEHGCRTVVIYSPADLSCYWNQVERSPTNPAVIKAFRVGENVIDYATGREMPADKLTIREVARTRRPTFPGAGRLRVAKLKHAGEWNIAPQAIPNLMESLSRPPLGFDVMISQKDLFAHDPDLIYYPLVYLHGRAAVRFDDADMQALAAASRAGRWDSVR